MEIAFYMYSIPFLRFATTIQKYAFFLFFILVYWFLFHAVIPKCVSELNTTCMTTDLRYNNMQVLNNVSSDTCLY